MSFASEEDAVAMNGELDVKPDQRRYWPLAEITLSRTREFYRQPGRVFWVYGFPILMMIALGVAFRNQGVGKVAVDVEEGPRAREVADGLPADRFTVRVGSEEDCRRRLRTAKTELVVVTASSGEDTYLYDPTRRESVIARDKVNDALQRAAGRKDAVPVENREVTEPGSRYIDFLVPGLLGMSLMGGGMYGVAYVLVDMRIRKLLKRFLATPMRKADLLAGIMLSRMVFKLLEIVVLLAVAYFLFQVAVQGSWAAVTTLVVLGALSFSGLGLLIGARPQTLESAHGLMNAVQLPMWGLSGVFFSSDRFPAAIQPVIKALPLTALIDALRGVILEGNALWAQWPQIVIMTAWGVGSFVLALKWFRWS